MPLWNAIFSSNILASSYVVYDPHAMASDISRAIEKLEDEQVTKILTLEEAMQMVTDRSLVDYECGPF